MTKQLKIYISVLLTLVFTMLGCGLEEVTGLVDDVKTLSEVGLRQVESAVIPIAKNGEDAKAPDLLIFNRQLDPPPVEFYLSYAYKTEDRWEIRWEHNLGGNITGYTDVTTLADETRVYVIVGQTAQALNLSDGAVEWETSLSDEIEATCRECAALAKERLVVLTSDLVLQGVDINSGQVAWSYEMNASSGWQIKPVILDEGDKVALVDQINFDAAALGALQLFDAGDGELLQSIVPHAGIPFRASSPLFIDKKSKTAYFTFSSGITNCIQGWDIEKGRMLWETVLPEEISKSPSFFDDSGLLADGILYHGSGGLAKKGKLVTIDLSNGAINLLHEYPKYAITPFLKGDGALLVRASRTKGSKQDELWGVDTSSGEVLWQYELQADKLMGWGSNNFASGTWTLVAVEGGVAVIQIVSDGDLDYVVIKVLNLEDGAITANTRTLIDDKHWMGTASTRDRVYLSIRNLYSVDLETGDVEWEWPLSAAPLDLIDPSGN